MECNKDDANKAKVIAERKITEKDFAGAKKFALKAQALYPGTEGLSQLMMTIDVYVFAEKKISGEVDWYGVLGVTPTADDETVRKQYRKLALMLHPDKNKCIGADGAFKLISEAWSLLSDKAKRLAYNQRRSLDRFHNVTNRSSSSVRQPNNVPHANPTSAPNPSVQKSNSFWTTCLTCKMHYEYRRMHLNNTLLCARCQKPFKAVETAPPSKFCKPPNSTSNKSHQKPTPASNYHKPPNMFPHQSNNVRPATAQNTGLGGSGGAKFPQFFPGRTTSVGPTVSSPSVAARAANVVQQASERIKRSREEVQGAGSWEQRVKYARTNTRELTPLETYHMLIKKAKTEIRKKLSEFSSEALTKAADSKKENVSNVKPKSSEKVDTSKLKKNGVSNSTTRGDEAKKPSSKTSTDADQDDVEITVPDPDFYEFDQERMESSFEENQVWAAYDDDDGMPRFYAMVHKVISLKPFNMRISWLESKTNTEFSNMKWVGCGFYKSCGEFRVGKPELTKSLNSFSHKVKWVKGGPTGSIRIIPKKGEVWALYRNWSRDWNELTPDEVIHKYDVVEVLEDYNEGQGVTITPLIKVSGFRTVFRTCTGPENIQTIAKEEMLRFSHQIPNHLLTGEEAKDAPKGLQELDTASTPLELIQAVTETNEKKNEGN